MTLLEHAIEQWKTTPELRAQDAYKWLYQATLGGEHAIQDEAWPRTWLDQEWEVIGAPMDDERETQELTPGGSLIRVNLRPYKARGGDKEALLGAFVSSAMRFHGDKAKFIEEWGLLGMLLGGVSIGLMTYDSWRDLGIEMEMAGYPAAHHSPEYEEAYRPAYRVVLGDLWSGGRLDI